MSIDAEEITEKDKRAHLIPTTLRSKKKKRNQKISNEDPYVPHVYVKKRTAEY